MTYQPSAGRNQPLDQLALVYAMVDHIQRARQVDSVYQEAAEGLRNVLSADRSALMTEERGAGMRLRAWGGLSSACRRALSGYSPWPRGQRHPEPLVIVDASEERLKEPVYDALRAEGLRSIGWIPLLHRGRLIGQLMLGRAARHPFDGSELRLAEVIAGHVAFSIWRTQSDEDQAELLRRFEAERSVLESVVKQMPAGVLLADVPSGRIITSNAHVSSIWRKTLRHAERVSDYAMWGGLDRDGAALDPRLWPLARSVETGETVQGEEIRIERGDGTRGIVRMSSAPVVDSRGRQLAAVATIFDVTREREHELRSAFLEDATQVLNASLDLATTLRSVASVAVGRYADWAVLHEAAGAALEATVVEHAAGERAPEALWSFLDTSLSLDGSHPVARAVREREPVLAAEDRPEAIAMVAGADERLAEAAREIGCRSAVVLPLVSREQGLGALTIVRSEGQYTEDDLELLTELARRASLAVENARLYERALAADRAKSSFLAVMSHEFRTPLSAILGYADILTARVHGELNPKQQEHLGRVKASVRHLSHLVDEILSFASMEAGRERVGASRADIRALVVDAAEIMEPIAEAAGLGFRLELPEEALVMRTDSMKVRQIVINLVSNALKYTPEGEVVVELETADGRMTLHVTDTGPGIAPEHAERVFEPFWQVDQSDGRRITGTGLGLAVARELARLLGGDVTLESEVGKGSRFTLTLPPVPEGVAGGAPV
jgi:signal transduction histidine kinase